MIKFESVGKTFRDGTSAVVDLDLEVPSGKITVIVGPSGCGKTTTLRMVNRMLEPTKGRILWDGTPIKSRRKTTLRRQMGYVIQSGGLFPHRTVVDNIGTVPGLLGWKKQKIHARAAELLDSVGLDRKLAHRYPAQLSGGQQQRVGVARALAADPLVMLMDEPFSAVDPVVRAELHEFFLGLQRELSKTIILITHDIDEAIKLGDQVAILRVGGKLAQAGTPQEVLEQPSDSFVEGFVGRDRGYRSLSFLSASRLTLDRVPAVRDEASAPNDQPALVIDAEAKPLGWADPRQPGQTSPLGATFDPEKDNLRTALDSALTSQVGLAVAVGADGRYAGVATAASILEQVTQSKVAEPEAISVSETADQDSELAEGQEEESRPEPAEGPEEARPESVDGPEHMRPEPVEGPEEQHPEPVEGDEESRPEPVEGPVEQHPGNVEGGAPESPNEPSGSTAMSPSTSSGPDQEPVEGSSGSTARSPSTSSGHEPLSEEPATVPADPGQPQQPVPGPDRPQR